MLSVKLENNHRFLHYAGLRINAVKVPVPVLCRMADMLQSEYWYLSQYFAGWQMCCFMTVLIILKQLMIGSNKKYVKHADQYYYLQDSILTLEVYFMQHFLPVSDFIMKIKVVDDLICHHLSS